MLKLLNIQKKFNSNHVLRGIDLTIHAHDLIYIYGINGCGKSTLFKIICDILSYDSGKIEKDNHLKIGALIENPGFLENESLKTNMKFLANLTKSYHEDKIRELCTRFQLDYDSKTAMKAYSVGMRQKVGIIQAIMEDQNLILFDEPTRGLDEESIKVFINLVNQLVEDGKAVVIASHDYLKDIKFTKTMELVNGVLELK